MSSKTKTTATKEEAKPEMVPKLRFPEFRGAEGWEPKRLGLALKFQAGFPFPSAGFNDAGKGLRLIRNRDLRSDDIVKFYSEDFDPNFVVNNGDVLVGMDGDFTPTVWEKGEALLNQRVGRILPRGDNDHRFLLYLLTLCLKGIEEATARTTVKHLSHSAVEDRHEPLPSPAEQQKIAECLSSVDELMAAQARKVDALKTHKKGLMQQLFPREGETQPRLRFPEFQNTGEWKPTSFGALGLDVSDGNYSSKYPSQSDFVANGVPFLRANNLKFGTVSDDDMRFISKEQHSQITKGHLKQGDILITTRGELGTVALVPARHIGSNINAQIVRINSGNKLVNTFLFQLLDYSRVIGLFDALSTGTALKQLPIGKLNQLALRIPEIREEQERIASCLSSLDALITAETQKLETLKIHKKGLMQQLFPSPEEVEA